MSQEKPLAAGSRPHPERFPKEARLLKRPAFTSVYNAGRKLHGRRFVLFAVPVSKARSRLGITVTKKVGGAVVRNRLKRQVREIYRRWRSAPPKTPAHGFELVVNVTERAPGAAFADLREELETLLARALGVRP